MVVASRSCSRRRLPRPRDLLRTLAPGLPVGFQDDDAQPRRQAALRSGTSAVRSGETRPSQLLQACRRRREREADLLLQLLSSGGSDHTAEDDGLPLLVDAPLPLPPHAEYAYTLHVTEKSDVFSFGVVILELVTGKSPITPEIGEKDLVAWVCDNIDQNSVESVLDHKIVEQFKNEMRKVLNIGLLCVNKSPEDRPPMRSVVKMLLEVEGENKP